MIYPLVHTLTTFILLHTVHAHLETGLHNHSVTCSEQLLKGIAAVLVRVEQMLHFYFSLPDLKEGRKKSFDKPNFHLPAVNFICRKSDWDERDERLNVIPELRLLIRPICAAKTYVGYVIAWSKSSSDLAIFSV